MTRTALSGIVMLALYTLAWPARAGLLLPTVYQAAAIHLHVVDADTDKPLPGAVALAAWMDFTVVRTINFPEGGYTYHITCQEMINEATGTSDNQGLLVIPPWSGKVGHCQSMYETDPRIVIYRPGYEVQVLSNYNAPHASPASPLNSLLPGISSISTPWDGGTVRLYRLGLHKYAVYAPRTPGRFSAHRGSGQDPAADNYVMNLKDYAGALLRVLAPGAIGVPTTCFFQEGRPAMRLMLEEKQRLRPFLPSEFPDFHLPRSNGSKDFQILAYNECGDQTAFLASLWDEVKDVEPLVPDKYDTPGHTVTLPLPSGQGFSLAPTALQGISDTGALIEALPPELMGPQDKQSLAQERHAVIYHVDIDPAEPYFVWVAALKPLRYLSACFVPIGMPRMNFHNERRLVMVDLDTMNDWGLPSYYDGCSSVAVLRPARAERDVPEESRVLDTYDDAHKRWTLSDRIFARPGKSWLLSDYMTDSPYQTLEQLPDYLEVDGKAPLDVVTDLKPVGPRRWELPAVGAPFTFSVCLKTNANVGPPPPAGSTSAAPVAAARCAAGNP